MKRINPNSPIRSGYKFEDLFVLHKCAEWLKNPSRIQQIRIQFIPDHIASKNFSIDDVVVVDSREKYYYYQLKHKQHPDRDLWTMQEVVAKGLEKWVKSYLLIRNSLFEQCCLITNGRPDQELLAIFKNNHISYPEFKGRYLDEFNNLSTKFTNEDLKDFFDNFQFIFSFPSKAEFDQEIRQVYYRDLMVTRDGVNNLLLYIAELGEDPTPKRISLADIRSRLSWDSPRPLNQQFNVPLDFEFFDKKLHEQLIKQILDPKGGLQVIVGKPGTGKSTYLAELYKVLQSKYKIIVARHHYHLNLKDSSFRERLNADRVREALRAELKKCDDNILGDLSYQNTEHVPLREFINKIAQWSVSQHKCFVLIIDGLDHVIREGRHQDELREFLNDVLYPQPGFYLLLGTQEMSVPYFPNIIFKECQKDKWIEIKGLKKEAIEKILAKHGQEIHASEQTDFRNQLFSEIYFKCAGNPLHLRYILLQLKNAGGALYADELNRIPAYNGEIGNYYTDLWRQIPSVSKSMCFAIAYLDFKMQEEELIDLARFFTPYPPQITEYYARIKHLIKADPWGINVYHNSFMVFLLSLEELKLQKKATLFCIRDWLKEVDNEQLRWSELAKIEYFLGNDTLLLSLDRNWIIESFLDCRDEEQIEKMIDLAAKAAFQRNDYAKVFYYSTLAGYFSNRNYNLFGSIDRIWSNAFHYKKKAALRYPDFSKLTPVKIKEMLIALKEKGAINKIPEEVFNRFDYLMNDQQYEQSEIITTYLQLIGSFEYRDVKQAFNFIIQFRDNNSSRYFVIYCKSLIQSAQTGKIRQLARLPFNQSERNAIAEILASEDLINGNWHWRKTIKKLAPSEVDSHFLQFYLVLAKDIEPPKDTLGQYADFPTKLESHSSAFKETELYIQNFYAVLFSSLLGRNDVIQKWIKKAPDSWPIAVMCAAVQAAVFLASNLSKKRKVSFATAISFFDHLPELDYHEHFDIYELKRVVIPTLIKLILKLHTIVNIYLDIDPRLSYDESVSFISNKWIYDDDRIELLLSKGVLLSNEGFENFRQREVHQLSERYIQFKDKAERLVNLAAVAMGIGRHDAVNEINKEAAENIISYGHHKDMTLHVLLRAIEFCAEYGSKKVKGYLRAIAPYVDKIRDLTDGDETHSFIYDLGEMLIKYDRNIGHNLYINTIEDRNYNLQEILFTSVLENLNIKDPIDNSLALTAVDRNSHNTLIRLAKSDSNFRKVLKNIQKILGPVDYSDSWEKSDESPLKYEDTNDEEKESIQPCKLAEYFEQIMGDNYYQRRGAQSDFLLSWSRWWLSTRSKDQAGALEALKALFNSYFHEIHEKVLDVVYPLAYKYNKQFAFQCLVWSMANSNSWSREYIRNMADSRKRWLIAIKDFPDKLDDFFHESIRLSGWWKEVGADSFYIPFPKAIKYFIDSDKLATAESLIEAFIQFLPNIFPRTKLPVPNYIEKEKNITVFDLLLNRLQEVSPLVRERAGSSISELLVNDVGGATHKKFVGWLVSQPLENSVCEGLLIIIKSLQNKKSNSFKQIDILTLSKKLSANCWLITVLLNRIAQTLSQAAKFQAPHTFATSFNTGEVTKDQFYKKLSNFLPLCYHDYLDQLEKKSGVPLWAVWHSWYETECERLQVKEKYDDLHFLNQRDDHATGRYTIFTDILRSTFLKLLDYLFDFGAIGYWDRYFFAKKNLQVDISWWLIGLGKKPAWWPKFDENSKSVESLKDAGLDVSLEKLIYTDQKHQLLYLNGYISPSNKPYEDKLQGKIEIVTVVVKKGLEKLSAEDIYHAINNVGIWYPNLENVLNIGIFESPLKYHQGEIGSINQEYTPLVSNLALVSPNMWQYYRRANNVKLLHPILADQLKFIPSANGIFYKKDKAKIAYVFDFADGIRDRSNHLDIEPSGNYVLIQSEFLKDILEKKGFDLLYIMKKYLILKNYNEKVEELTVFSFLD